MKYRILVIFILLAGISAGTLRGQNLQAEKVPTGPMPYGKSNLTPVQQEGQRTFMQRCSVCHVPGTPTGRVIGVRLTKEIFVGNETAIRQFIMVGTDRMPGFRYALSPSQIDAIIDYLKTGMEATDVDQSGPPPAKEK
jgi:mono/diheme cytochrome c family protein